MIIQNEHMKDRHSSRYEQADDEAMVSKHHHQHLQLQKDGASGMRKVNKHQQRQKQQQQQEQDEAVADSEHRQPPDDENEEKQNKKESTNSTTGESKKYEVGVVEIASNLSDLSGSTGDAESASEVQQLSARNADVKEFEILIQAKHAEACKAMGVSLQNIWGYIVIGWPSVLCCCYLPVSSYF